MANNILLGGFTVATDDITGVHHQRIKIQFGAEDSATDVSTAAPLPVSDAGGSLTVDGTVGISGTVPVSDAGGSLTVDGTVAVTNADLATLAGAVAGTEVQVDVLTMPTVTVTGTVAATNSDLATLAGTVAGTEMQADVVSITRPSTIVHGQTNVTTPGTEVVLGSSAALLSGVTVKAKSGNTGDIFVGANPVTSSTGFILDAGEQVYIDISNINLVYVDSAQAGEGVSWIGS